MNHFTKYKHVYEPFKIGKLTVKNRFEMPPLGPRIGAPAVTVGAWDVAYYGERARAGAGIVTIPDVGIDTTTACSWAQNYWIDGERSVCELNKLVKSIHRYGALASIELNHAGQMANAISGKSLAVSDAAGVEWNFKEFAGERDIKVMDQQDIDYVVGAYAHAAKICKEAGFDMIMLHGAHGTLLAQFVSPLTNQRTDKYGGSPENRINFHLEVLKAIRAEVGEDYPIEIRVSWTEHTSGGLELEDVIEYLKVIEPYIDLVHVSAGAQPTPKSFTPYYYPKLVNTEAASKIKAALHIPVVAMGGITTLQEADDIIASGKADMIAMGRQSLADDQIYVKGARGLDDSEMRPCLRCGHCITNGCMMESIGCTVNPRIGNELHYPANCKAMTSKKVVIIGGGPAGMQAALTATERGHQVVLFEKNNALGGLLPEVCSQSFKTDHKRYFDWMVRKINACGAQIKLGVTATPEVIAAENPDAVIIAVGGRPITLPAFPIDNEKVVLVNDVDLKKVPVGNKVLIAGGGISGVESAMELADEGKEVTIVDVLPIEGWAGVLPMYYDVRIQLLKDKNVTMMPQTRIVAPTVKGAMVIDEEGNEAELEADTIIFAIGIRPDSEQVEALSTVVPETYVIGDAYGKGDMYDATHSAYFCAMEL